MFGWNVSFPPSREGLSALAPGVGRTEGGIKKPVGGVTLQAMVQLAGNSKLPEYNAGEMLGNRYLTVRLIGQIDQGAGYRCHNDDGFYQQPRCLLDKHYKPPPGYLVVFFKHWIGQKYYAVNNVKFNIVKK